MKLTPGGNETSADIYTPTTNTWNKTGSTQYARAGASLVTLGKRVFAIGGNWNPSPSSLAATVEEYSVITGTWFQSHKKNFFIV
jgi:N-acetylneuraminic acid mutarotase